MNLTRDLSVDLWRIKHKVKRVVTKLTCKDTKSDQVY